MENISEKPKDENEEDEDDDEDVAADISERSIVVPETP